MTRRIFYVAQYFTPEPYLKDIKFIKSLKDKGWEPIVITGFPNYPSGKIYPNYNNTLIYEEDIEGIKVIRTYTYADHSLNVFKRVLNYFVFSLFASYAIIRFGKKDSLYYILQSSPFVVLISWTVKLFKRNAKTLLDIQDVFPENIRVSGVIKHKYLIGFLDFILNNFYYKSFDYFITVSRSFKKIVNSKGVLIKEILTLYNWSLVENNNESKEEYRFPGNYYNIVYAGNIGVHQGLSLLTTSYKQIEELFPNVRFHFFGDGTDMNMLRQGLEDQQVSNVVLHGRVSSSDIYKYLEAADCLFLHLIADPIYKCIIPSKLQAYIEVSKPILAGIQGEAEELVVENKLGEVFMSEDVSEMIDAVKKLVTYNEDRIQQVYENSKKLYFNEFSRSAGVKKLDLFLNERLFNNEC